MADDTPTPEPDFGAFMTPLETGAAAMHEMYRANMEAGFTPQEALQIALELTKQGMMSKTYLENEAAIRAEKRAHGETP